MTPYYADDTVTLHHGDCLDVLRSLPDNSVDAVVTDPPYGLEFMGKDWDSFGDTRQPGDATFTPGTGPYGRAKVRYGMAPSYDSKAAAGMTGTGYTDGAERLERPSYLGGLNPKCRTCGKWQRGGNPCACDAPDFPNERRARTAAFGAWCEEWAAECLRVLKPGGHLLAFGGTRTWHRLACAVEDAGFELRDSIGYASGVLAWVYGSGFPKSLNVSKDARFCQCLSDVRDAATDEAAESAAQVLLSDLRRGGEAEFAGATSLHGVRVDVHPDYAGAGGTEQDVLAGVRETGTVGSDDRAPVSTGPTSEARVRPLRHRGAEVAEQGEAVDCDLLHPSVPLSGEPADVAGECLRRDGQAGGAAVRGGQPSLEGRGDVQAAEGELQGRAAGPLPTGLGLDGDGQRVHQRTPARDGSLGGPPTDAQRVREPHQPRPVGQPAGEPGPLADEWGPQARRGWPLCPGCSKPRIPAGLGTALKPSWEPVVVARKPLSGTVAANVQQFGTGALNVDGCRVPGDVPSVPQPDFRHVNGVTTHLDAHKRNGEMSAAPAGRWPTNVVLDEHAAEELDRQSGTLTSGAWRGVVNQPRNSQPSKGDEATRVREDRAPDSGGASRFFPVFRYQAKAPTRERPKVGDVAHPTVKPLALMQWLVRLVTPPGGVVLEPFAGSGTTVEACLTQGFRCIAIEREADYLPLIEARIARQRKPDVPNASEALALFDFEEPA